MTEPYISLREFEARFQSLRDLFEVRLDEMNLRLEQRFIAQEKANADALVSTEKALSAALLSAKESTASDLESTRILANRSTQLIDQKFETHNAIRPWVTDLFSAVSNRITQVEQRVARFENREEGMSMTTKFLISSLGVVATLIGLYFAFKK